MRRTEFDLCRVFACLFILLVHTGADVYHQLPLESFDFFAVSFLSTMSRSALPLFFMLSGALLLSRETMDPMRVLRHNVLRLTGLYYLWSFLYALARAASGAFDSQYAFWYDVVAGHYHLWFLPAMVVVYLFLPVVHAAVHRGGLDRRYLVGLFLFLGIFLANCNLTPDPAPILYRFTQNFSLDYLPYLGYAVWGWYLSERAFPRRTLWLAPAVFLLATLGATLANRWYSLLRAEADGWLFSHFSLPGFIQTTAMFCFFLALRGRRFRQEKAILALSGCTLGVYLIHPLMINLLERVGLAVTPRSPVLSLLGVTALLAALCFALVMLARRVPFLRRIL